MVLVVKFLSINENHVLKAVSAPIGGHGFVALGGNHAVVFLGVAVPDEDGQEVGDGGVGRVEVGHTAGDVGFSEATIADRDGEELTRVQKSARHGEMLALTEGTGGIEQAGDEAGKVAEEAVGFPEAIAKLGDGVDAHLL